MKKILALFVAGLMLVPLMASAFTITVTGRDVVGSRYVTWGTLAFDSSYATGGEAIPAASLGFIDIDWIDFTIIKEDADKDTLAVEVTTVGWDPVNETVWCLGLNSAIANTLNYVPATTDLSAFIVRFRAEGR